MPKAPRSARLNLRITEQLKRDLEELAEKDRRSVSDYAAMQLELVVLRARDAAKKKG